MTSMTLIGVPWPALVLSHEVAVLSPGDTADET